MRNVIIGTPSYDGKVDVLYVNSMIETLLSKPENIQIFPIFIPNDALVQRARNELIRIAVSAFDNAGIDDIVFIDADIFWDAKDFYKLLNHDVDIVGGLYRQKSDKQVLVFRDIKDAISDEKNLLEVNGVGCGFLRMSKNAINKLWASSKEYKNGEKSSRAVFEVIIDEDGELTSEDITMCKKWKNLGEKIYVDTSIQCGHIGSKQFIIN